jgi:hypothetical protein
MTNKGLRVEVLLDTDSPYSGSFNVPLNFRR